MYKFFLIISISLFPYVVSAATISFDPQETTVGPVTPFLVGITIDADRPVNTISMVIDIPDTMDVLDASDGNSVINMWIERPHITDGHQLVFSGIIPGGFEGRRGKLVTLTMRAKKEGTYTISVSPSARMYENTPTASGQTITSAPLELRVVHGKDNIPNPIPDTVPPESFVPVIIELTGDGSERSAVSFQTQDKGSGIASYAVAESTRNISLDSVRMLSGLSWNESAGPYILADQRLFSYVYVKAVDVAGNVRYAKIEPQRERPWYRRPGSYIIYVLIALALLRWLYLKSSIRIHRRR